MAKVRSTETVRRYTDLPALLHLLRERAVTLLDPSTWDDTNDSYYLLRYKERRALKSVLALCMTQAAETYHHWRIFSHGPAGVCVDFHRQQLIAKLEGTEGVTVRPVQYRMVRVGGKPPPTPSLAELPFLKRRGFIAEEEIRAVYESSSSELKYLNVPIELSMIRRVTLSPWLSAALKPATAAAIHGIRGCESLDVRRSTLVGNAEWKRIADAAAE